MKITIQIAIKNNKKTIKETLSSILEFNAEVIAINLGSKDGTSEICRRNKIEIFNPVTQDYSQIRNEVVDKSQNKWQMYIEPWEEIVQEKDFIRYALNQKPEAYVFGVLQGKLLTKEIRLWHKDLNLKFRNPVYPNLFHKNPSYSPIIINSRITPANNEQVIEEWRKRNPMSPEPYYHKAFNFLIKGNWEDFMRNINDYFFREKSNDKPFIMANYYCAMGYCYLKKDYNEALKRIVICLEQRPTMAEFWCLAGDCLYMMDDYDKAIALYENAIILGSRRLNEDMWPLEIDKYKDYPKKMIKNCLEIRERIKVYRGNL